jgi:type II secretory pathway pseudopilin PulG
VTLIELMVVLVLLSIVAAVVIPQAVQTSDLEVVSAARVLAADLNYAQDLAITSQTPVTLTFNVTGNSYTLSNESGTLIHPITKEVYVTVFSAENGFGQVEVVSATFGPGSSVTFDELGSPNSSGTVVLQAGPYTYHVSVAAATGRVTVTRIGS